MSTITTLLLDRDGTLIRESARRVVDPAQVRLRRDVLRALAGLELRLFGVTNQSVIGRGLATAEGVEGVNAAIAERYARHGVVLSAFLVCPHAPAEGCGCRKPAPGLLHRARDEHGVELQRALMVGDHLSDAQAAVAAGCGGALLLRNHRLAAELRRAALPERTLVVDAAQLRAAVQDWPAALAAGAAASVA